MFRCVITNKITKPGEKMFKLVVKTRDRVYMHGDKVIGKGTEIVKEISVSEEGLKIHQAEQERTQTFFASKAEERRVGYGYLRKLRVQ